MPAASFNGKLSSLVFHYDFMCLMDKTFQFWGTKDGYFRLNDYVYSINLKPNPVMLREPSLIPNELTINYVEARMSWTLQTQTYKALGIEIKSLDGKKVYFTINFDGNIVLGEPVNFLTRTEDPLTQWDFFSERV
jgi:hypothetical protein